MSAVQHTPGLTVMRDSMGWVTVRDAYNGTLRSQSVEATLLYLILQRLPDPNEPLAEAIEWEMLDGTERTTNKELARNWAAAVGVRVVRRAALSKATHPAPYNTAPESAHVVGSEEQEGVRFTSWCDTHSRATPCDKCAAPGVRKDGNG